MSERSRGESRRTWELPAPALAPSDDPLAFFHAQMAEHVHTDEVADEDGKERRYSIGTFIRTVLFIDDEASMRRFHAGYLVHLRATFPQENAEKVAQANIGWCFGEGMSARRQQMWIRACNASHPVFGQARVTDEEAFQAGLALGRQNRE